MLLTLHSAATPFEAACHIPALPEGHRARRLHGHSFLAQARCALPLGWAPFKGAEVSALRERLEAAAAPLDHALLNDLLPNPTDENIARWLQQRLAGGDGGAPLPGLQQLSVYSTTHSGVDVDLRGRAHVWRRYRFQSAHWLPHVPPGHKCGRLHGHGFEVIVHANQDLGERELSIDYDHLDALWAPLHFELNYRCLNEMPGLENPTSEMLSRWIWERLKPQLPELSWVTVFETGSSGANFDGARFRIWKEFTLDSAVQLKNAPPQHPLASVHGHTFTLRLHLQAELHQLYGWAVDFGDVKERFNPVFKRLDHHPLHLDERLTDGDCASLAAHILREARAVLPETDRVDLYETRGCGAVVTLGDTSELIPV
ncbi:6-pyruvoyltetrahydropterin/6-carboxytetrahydropterin synthase [Inhella inkyongensis]|uniref:6-carboxy-5,6,7,8-tetrahydropterin synthase n=1 Tax=Inhella inkyongensis TaxID=392593 RepID=A0A840S809_9BURK|nr:6-carboxytetrahydropterin synthase [Inhella inkyongensis]MBB5205146.1 6-pyruvoyltetrahydropterin/6-carboxytetrahydropterin synthase [Inhella inkyongensis]